MNAAQDGRVTDLNLPLLDAHKPATFGERGVAVPFTTPRLAGARMRRSNRTGSEFIIPNPSGGRGVYVLDWGAVRQLCRPTVHDTLLYKRIARLPVIDPAGVRDAARQAAEAGFAGRDAARAAAQMAEADRQAQVLTNFLLLLTLMEQIEPIGLALSADTERTPELDRRARRIVSRVAAALNSDLAAVVRALEELSARFAPIGLGESVAGARVPLLLTRLLSTASGFADWAERFHRDDLASVATSLARAARTAEAAASAALRDARALTADMPVLIQAWLRQPEAIAAQTSRADWILDGWEWCCLLWETETQPAGQRAIVRELIRLAPVPPRSDWVDHEPETERGGEPADEPWREDAARFGLIARNERLRAASR
jgi:hypothetical protein